MLSARLTETTSTDDDLVLTDWMEIDPRSLSIIADTRVHDKLISRIAI